MRPFGRCLPCPTRPMDDVSLSAGDEITSHINCIGGIVCVRGGGGQYPSPLPSPCHISQLIPYVKTTLYWPPNSSMLPMSTLRIISAT